MRRFIKACIIFAFYAYTSLSYGDTLTISGNPATFTINTATAGQQPNSVTNTSTTYSVSTTLTVRSIVGAINTNMPTGVTFTVSLAAPTGATSLGAVSMTTTNKNLITGIPIVTTASGKIITYKLSATVSAAKVTNATKTLTLTLQ